MNIFDVDNLTGRNHAGIRANTPVKFLTASSVMEDTICDPAGDKLGEIRDIMLNVQDGSIEYVVMESGGFLGFKQKYFAIPYKLLRLDAQSRTFVFDLDSDILRDAPGFDRHHWPLTNDHSFESANIYWSNFMGPNVGSVPY